MTKQNQLDGSDAAAVNVGKSRGGRTSLAEIEKRKVWVRAGGTCVTCKRYLLDGPLTGLEVSLGELAHIVGQQNSARSPRGLHPMPRRERDTADNVLLLCETCHGEIDSQTIAGILDVEILRELKRAHESRIRHVTSLPDDKRTVILRVVGKLRGNALELTRTTAAEAVIADASRFPWFPLAFDSVGLEVDLTALAGEDEADDAYYGAARKAIDEVIDTRLRDAITSGAARHVSVFAFARLPLLVYLGTKLDDTFDVDLYQRHRHSDGWRWDSNSPVHTFTATVTDSLSSAADVVLILNVSGVIDETEIPDDVAALPRITVAPNVPADVDIMRARATLDEFSRILRDVYASLDAHKNVKRLHVFAAAPITAAVQLGRLRDPHIHPALVIHDRTHDGGYRRTLEIT